MKKMMESLGAYRPLMRVILVILAVALGMQWQYESWNMNGFMHAVMGLFFVIFALFKFIDPDGFAKGFALYDHVAKQYPIYGRIFPYIELMLGTLYLAHAIPITTYLVTIMFSGANAWSVYKALKAGVNVQCACLGTVLKLPLSTVSLLENILTMFMALWMLLGL